VQSVQSLWGPLAIAVICLLVFVEEAGVPLPMFPGDGLLLVAGIMISAGQITPWLFVPLAFVACVSGALLGYLWSRHLGRERLERLADRLHLRGHLIRASERLRRTGAIGVLVGRILPGSRVYTNLVTGVTGIPLSAFLRGLIPSAAIWLGLWIGLGVAVGVPAAPYVHEAESLFGRAALVAISLLGSLVVLRLVRAPDVGTGRGGRPAVLRLVAAIGLDVIIVGAVAAATSSTLLTGAIGVAMAISLTLLVYVAATRLALGSTPGERLGRFSYRELLPSVP
jgi:membrane protein DedA with SNARE-associated domain